MASFSRTFPSAAPRLPRALPIWSPRWMIGACRSHGPKTAHVSADIVCWYLRSQVSSRNFADPLPATRAVGRLRSQGRHSDGNATAPPDSAAVPVVFRDRHVFAARVRLCGCAGRSYPSHSTSQLHELMGASPATRTRQVHAVSRWHRSRTGVSLPCAPKYLSALAHSDGKRASRSSLATRAQKRPLPADLCGLVSPQAACSLCVTQGMHARSWHLLGCAWKAAAGGTSVRLQPRSCESDHDCSSRMASSGSGMA